MTKEMSKVWFNNAVPNKFNGHEGKTATLLSTGLFTLNLRVAVSPHVISTVVWLRINYDELL